VAVLERTTPDPNAEVLSLKRNREDVHGVPVQG
jgi:hypothetical protein